MTAILKFSFLVPIVAVGTMAFDTRVGLYDDPPNMETVKMIEATKETFKYLGKLSGGLEGLLFRFVTTPSFRKYCEVQDTAIGISQKFVDDKISELKAMAEEGKGFSKDGGKQCTTEFGQFNLPNLNYSGQTPHARVVADRTDTYNISVFRSPLLSSQLS